MYNVLRAPHRTDSSLWGVFIAPVLWMGGGGGVNIQRSLWQMSASAGERCRVRSLRLVVNMVLKGYKTCVCFERKI